MTIAVREDMKGWVLQSANCLGNNPLDEVRIGISIGIDLKGQNRNRYRGKGFPWYWNRYRNRPDMDKVSLSESEPKKLESPAPVPRTSWHPPPNLLKTASDPPGIPETCTGQKTFYVHI